MNYRHQMISDTNVPDISVLPAWFVEKYRKHVDLSRDYWATYSKVPLYGPLRGFEKDVQKVIKEVKGMRQVRLVYFANESDASDPDITHANITATRVKYRYM